MKLVQISLSTKNKQRLVDFYKKAFGFIEVAQWSKKDWGMSAVKLSRGVILLEISQTRKLVKDDRDFSYHNKGLNMLGFEVEDIKQVIDWVRKLGGKLREGPIKGQSVKYIAFIEDPDGNGIELIQPNLTMRSKYNIKILDWDREKLWSTGIITSDIILFYNAALENFWNKELEINELQKGLLKIGDMGGCPIPNKVAENLGAANAIRYLYGLSEDYNFIKQLLIQERISWKRAWGREERRLETEPLGEDGKNVPKGIRERKIMRGPGNYLEFSITRLLWIDKGEKNERLKLGRNKIIDIILNSESREDLQVNLIEKMADLRLNNGIPTSVIVDEVANGISHEAFFKQNNCYIRVKRSLELLEDKCRNKVWFSAIESKVNRVLKLPLSKDCQSV